MLLYKSVVSTKRNFLQKTSSCGPRLPGVDRLNNELTINCWPRKGTWRLEFRQALTDLSQLGNAVRGSFTLEFYKGLVTSKSNSVLDEDILLLVFLGELSRWCLRTISRYSRSYDSTTSRQALQALKCGQRDKSEMCARWWTCTVCTCLVSGYYNTCGALPNSCDACKMDLVINRVHDEAHPTTFFWLGSTSTSPLICLMAMGKKVVWWTSLKNLTQTRCSLTKAASTFSSSIWKGKGR